MIIGNNSNFNSNKNKFQNKMDKIKRNSELFQDNNINPFVEDVNSSNYSNASDTKNMNNKRLAMLNERLQAGLITPEQFHREVDKINRGY
jgi:hypothetical protein